VDVDVYFLPHFSHLTSSYKFNKLLSKPNAPWLKVKKPLGGKKLKFIYGFEHVRLE
jgi:hypothetical protein